MAHTDRTTHRPNACNRPEHASRDGGGQPAGAERANSDGGGPAIEGLDRYLVHLAHLDMALPVKIELLRALQAIMQSFVDRAFGDDPVQQVAKQHGRAEGKSDADGAGAALPMVDLAPTTPSETDDNNLTGAFRDQAGRGGGRK